MAALNPVSERHAAGRIATTADPASARRRIRLVVRLAAGGAIVVATALVVGFGPFLRGIAAISPPSILAALILSAIATAAAAWRWRTVATGYGLPLTRHAAFAACYRSQFLNAVLPAGILGDVHRAWAHGQAHARLGAAARAVVVERALGQVVQIALTLAVLLPLGLGSPLEPVVWGAGALTALLAAAVAIAAILPRPRRLLQREYALLRPVLARPGALLAIVLTSIVVVAAHVTLFVVAGLAVGLPLRSGLAAAGLVVLAASAIPVNVGGWGPREAAAGAAFGLVGLGAAAGVATSTAFGVLALVAVAPGAVVLLAGWRRRP
ncbi:lysylphosphatidylglycerol synthase transmembrane domain-containing protein [Microbacterium capsulatum]|uniref:Lysylphosphatidylglycerol synthase transmembrane domain-containing protein n=1 Tax=Microbacterium capsulatum TaxID=3041921 RepID=A0ABU0XGB6_9MICO|nr:lysylphosphatidylglycerol synthase transmembrane domain-containing protein [Microbacterium sp. ASV81]MDQ4212735.1 lysylphosphatidylglycerol synthase transmembrane domain-containing protein [Microbacterium sp. ASV81]